MNIKKDDIHSPTIESIKESLAEGVKVRENGDYIKGEELLTSSFEQSKNIEENALIVESGNQLSIQYRLSAGRYARKGGLNLARTYSLKALDTYVELERMGLLDPEHPATQRNYAHALLYSGFVKHSVTELKKSADSQQNDALRGDEICHLASAYLDEENRDLEQANSLVSEGIELIRNNNGSPIALTYGLMTTATVLALKGIQDEANQALQEALELSNDKDLKVRQEEIQYLMRMGTKAHILTCVSGSLREERRNQRYAR